MLNRVKEALEKRGYTVHLFQTAQEAKDYLLTAIAPHQSVGFGGSLAAQQHKAFKTALGNANGADALVGMSIEQSCFTALPFFMMRTIRVTGTPVKFNSPAAQ